MRLDLFQSMDPLFAAFSDLPNLARASPSDIEDAGLEYWPGIRLLCALRLAAHGVVVPYPYRDSDLRLNRVMEWDSDTLADYLVTKWAMNPGAAVSEAIETVRRERVCGYVFVMVDAEEEAEMIRRLVKDPKDRACIRDIISNREFR